jgi:hypothetical protein
MHRTCTNCERPFTPKDLAREISKGMEAERRALGLEGVLFRYYQCPACAHADIFVDVNPLPDEVPEDFFRRRRALEDAVRELHGERVEVVLIDKQPRAVR